ncbi:MAG: hypothetical protein KC656_00470 [Myxococcales bacterium]|nr:hypothetical protein [Myxococcales bacterium]MCB9670208.1 hypothetical protein [Alphaproteobacteria bacterium]MCB9694995.1 hypothetical protein [Alphaproteobacteria bacterium]
MLLLALLPSASARDVVHIALAHEWSERYTRDAGQMGPSIRADLGYGFGIGIGKLIPEVGTSIAYESGVVIPRAGVRAILGWLVTPGVYAHGNLALGGPFASPAPGFDAGLTVDLSLPFVRLGVFGGGQFFGGASGPTIPDQNVVFGMEACLSIPIGADDEAGVSSPSAGAGRAARGRRR